MSKCYRSECEAEAKVIVVEVNVASHNPYSRRAYCADCLARELRDIIADNAVADLPTWTIEPVGA